MKKLIAGNWKMNGSTGSVQTLAKEIAAGLKSKPALMEVCDLAICPPYVFIPAVSNIMKQEDCAIAIGAQDCASTPSGAFTGEVSAPMLKDVGCEYVIVGHSERRDYHQETSERVAQKAKAAHENGLIAIICVGETENQREIGQAEKIVEKQLKASIPETANSNNTVIAYEPVWAIGTGKTATPEDVASMHAFIREKLQEQLEDSKKVRILYGGSMKPENAKSLLATPNVDGGLIGGASLKAEQFLAIGRAAL